MSSLGRKKERERKVGGMFINFHILFLSLYIQAAVHHVVSVPMSFIIFFLINVFCTFCKTFLKCLNVVVHINIILLYIKPYSYVY